MPEERLLLCAAFSHRFEFASFEGGRRESDEAGAALFLPGWGQAYAAGGRKARDCFRCCAPDLRYRNEFVCRLFVESINAECFVFMAEEGIVSAALHVCTARG